MSQRTKVLTKAAAKKAIAGGKFIAIDPSGDVIPSIRHAAETFSPQTYPKWYTKLQKLEGASNSMMLDHDGMLKGTQTYIAQPYHLELADLEAVIALSKKWSLHLLITGDGSHFPGATFCVQLNPTMETYNLLKLPIIYTSEILKEDEEMYRQR